jgi:hypothetical protein
MLLRTLFFFFSLYPLLSYSQLNINLNDMDLEDIEIPPLSALEPLKYFAPQKTFPDDREAVFEKKGGIHEKFSKATYPKISDENIIWRESYLPSKNESYYLYFALGFGNISFDGSLSSNNNPAVDFNLLGIYWPKFNKKFMVGVVLDLTVNEFSIAQTTTNIYQPAVSLSMNYFFGQNIGSGLFARLDLGLGSVAFLKDEPTVYVLDYIIGGTMLAGVGYGIPISQETRLLINLDFIKKFQTYNNGPNGSNLGILSTGVLF